MQRSDNRREPASCVDWRAFLCWLPAAGPLGAAPIPSGDNREIREIQEAAWIHQGKDGKEGLGGVEDKPS